MSYYGVGDYYMAGDPGLFSSIGGFLKGAVKTGIGLVTGGPIGAIGGLVSSLGGPGSGPTITTTGSIPKITGGQIGGGGPAMAAGGAVPRGYHIIKKGPHAGKLTKNRRMNFANGRAIARANRRVDGFVRLARRSLKHTNYKIVSKSSGRRRVGSIKESGPGSVIVR